MLCSFQNWLCLTKHIHTSTHTHTLQTKRKGSSGSFWAAVKQTINWSLRRKLAFSSHTQTTDQAVQDEAQLRQNLVPCMQNSFRMSAPYRSLSVWTDFIQIQKCLSFVIRPLSGDSEHSQRELSPRLVSQHRQEHVSLLQYTQSCLTEPTQNHCLFQQNQEPPSDGTFSDQPRWNCSSPNNPPSRTYAVREPLDVPRPISQVSSVVCVMDSLSLNINTFLPQLI